MKPNRPHYHLWITARTGRMIYKLARGFHSRQAAAQWGSRHRPDSERMVMQCAAAKCAPKLDD